MPKPKAATSYKLPQDAKDLLDAMHEHLGTPKTYILGEAIRDLARKRGVSLDSANGLEDKKTGKKSKKSA